MKNLLQNKVILIISGLVIVLLIGLLVFSIFPKNKSIDNNGDAVVEESKEDAHAKALDEESEIEDEGECVFLIDKDDVNKFSLTDANGILLDFEKDGDEWICIGNEELDLDEERVDKILNYICDIKFTEMTTCEDGAEYGLTPDSKIFIVEDAGGSDVIVSLGNVEDDGSVYFALNYDFTKVFKNSGKLKNVCEYAIQELL